MHENVHTYEMSNTSHSHSFGFTLLRARWKNMVCIIPEKKELHDILDQKGY